MILNGNTPARLTLVPLLTRNDEHMAKGANAGIKRNRGPAGTKTMQRDVGLQGPSWSKVDDARGNASAGLYFEFLIRLVEDANGGKLPAYSPALYDVKEGRATTAA